MAVTRSNKRPATSAETGPPDSSSGKRRKVSKAKKSTPATLSSPPSKAVPASSPSPKKQTASRARSAPLHLSRSSHYMRTRAKARIFRFCDLPPEIRNLVYQEAYSSDEPVDLEDLQLPTELKVPGIFGEALPFFFEGKPIVITVMSNICVRFQHLHRSEHSRFERTGQVELPRMLQEGGLRRKVVRFKRMHYQVKCCCCDQGKVLVDVDVEAIQKGAAYRALVETQVVNRPQVYTSVVRELEKMVDVLKEAADEISGRESFNGFTVEDIKVLAMCFRNDDDDAKLNRDDDD